jgi:HEAT repeat protein
VASVHEDTVLAPRGVEPIRAYTEWNLEETVSDSLGRIGAAAVPSLVALLRDPDPLRRRRAAVILARIGPPAAEAVPSLVQALSDSDLAVRKSAARALGQIGPAAASAVPALIQVLDQDDAPSAAD